ncbi:M56 family metallopeptidase [uncultured Tenacibaculum sp.]|uniref:M56 family metallopeptidase n=1 Tax=uncultured Tenacibaculum sp. TaxID=174713 RepID=UPI002636E39D|nr:M56 family metallopeptidase [uncultured Tenacibaculum sp.]
MINYVIQVVLFQVLFVAVYDFFLSKETFFTKNRWYLLTTAVGSFILPLIKVTTIQKAVPQEYTILLPEVVLSPQKVIEKSAWYQSINYLDVLFYAGCILFTLVFVLKLYRIVRLIFVYGAEKRQNYRLVLLPKNSKAFSFFNYIFLGKGISSDKQEKIIQHELVHSQQKHSLDLLFFEALKIVMWFNPMVYIYQNRVALVHEYISDEVVSKSTPKENYINNLLSDIFQVESISFINQFYKHSLIKKRIRMMTKNKSKQIKQLKYLLLVPVLASMLLYTACSDTEKSITEPKLDKQRIYFSLNENPAISETKMTYMDVLISKDAPETQEYALHELSKGERKEYEEVIAKRDEKEKLLSNTKIRFFEGKDGRKIMFSSMKDMMNAMKSNMDTKRKLGNQDAENVPFVSLDKYPTFPGCVEANKECFNKKLMKFVAQNFDTKLANKLGLEKGKKRIYVQFKIGKNGEIKDVRARAPHPTLKEHAMEIVHKLPKMLPGEKDGKKVITGYTLPITFNVE